MKKIWIVVVAVVCAGVFFYVGMIYGKSTVSAGGRGAFAGFTASSTRGGFGGRAGAGGVIGQIISAAQGSVTVQLANGNSQVVFYSSSTQIEEPAVVSPSVLTSGTQITVIGTANSDGSMTAQRIQVSPAGANSGLRSGGAGAP